MPERPSLTLRSYIFNSKDEAWGVIVALQDVVSSCGNCTVADFKKLVGVGISYADTIWGWTDLQDVGVERGEFGYYLVLPDIECLEV